MKLTILTRSNLRKIKIKIKIKIKEDENQNEPKLNHFNVVNTSYHRFRIYIISSNIHTTFV